MNRLKKFFKLIILRPNKSLQQYSNAYLCIYCIILHLPTWALGEGAARDEVRELRRMRELQAERRGQSPHVGGHMHPRPGHLREQQPPLIQRV